jgi:hypothetical protein
VIWSLADGRVGRQIVYECYGATVSGVGFEETGGIDGRADGIGIVDVVAVDWDRRSGQGSPT